MRWIGVIKTALLRIISIVCLIGAIAPTSAIARTEVPFVPPPNPVWYSASGTSPTPDGACQLQHQDLNPGAPYQAPYRVSEQDYACNWIAKQYGGGDAANTILPFHVWLNCPGDLVYAESGTCLTYENATTMCNCPDPARAVSGPPSPSMGDPVNIPSGYLFEDETDYVTADGLLKVDRRYVSSRYKPTSNPLLSFGEVWQGLIPQRLFIMDSAMNTVFYSSGVGESQVHFSADSSNASSWTYGANVASRVHLTMVTTPTVNRTTYFAQAAVANGAAEFRLEFGNGEYILFRRAELDSGATRRDAIPIEHGYPNGYRQYFDYPDTGLFPNLVRDSFGRQLSLTWAEAPLNYYVFGDNKSKVISEVALPDGSSLHYDYEDANWTTTGAYTDTGGVSQTVLIRGRKDRLVSVRRLNALGATIYRRDYLYEDTRWPYALTGIKDQNGQRLMTTTYDQTGFPASTERAGGVEHYAFRQFRYDYGYLDGDHVYREVTNPFGRKELYELYQDGYFRPWMLPRWITSVSRTATSNVPAETVSYGYTGDKWTGAVSSTTDARGYTTAYTVDSANNRPTAITEAQGQSAQRVTNITWHSTFDLPTHEARTGLSSDYTYSSIGQLLTRTETDTTTHTVPYSTSGQTRTWTYTWGTGGRLASINGPRPIDALGKDDTLAFAYDSAGNLQTSTNGLGQVTSFASYDANGRPGTMTDPNGVVTAFTYDALGRTKTITVRHPTTSSLDAVTSLDYDVAGHVTSLTSPATDALLMDYNAAGQLTAIRAASGERIDFQNDALDNVTAETVKRANGTATRSITRTFDEIGRMLTETLGPGRTTSWTYDKNGNATQVVSARNTMTQAAFDPLNRLVSTVAPDTGTTSLVYNAIDTVTAHTDPISVQTTFVRDGFGDVIQEVSPDRGTSTYYYNEAGELTASIDGRGQRIDYMRDILGRVTSKTPVGHSSETIGYAWDSAGLTGSYGVGRLASVTDATGTTSFAYDHRGNLLTKRQTVGSGTADLGYSYDLADRITQVAYPSGRLVAYDRDSKGRVSQVRTKASASDPSWTSLASSITYEPWGSMTGAQFGNGLSMSQVWADGRLASKRLFNTSTSADLSSLAYTYDANDNVGAVLDQLNASNNAYYGYDASDRMAFSSVPVTAAGTGTDTYAYTTSTNRLASVTTAAGTRSISYDNRGNTVSETRPGSATVSAAYDGYARLLTYARTGDPSQANAYNGLDDRVSATSGSVTHRFVYDAGGRVIGEYGASAADVIAETIWMSPDASNDNEPLGGDDGVGGYAPLAVATGSGSSAALTWLHGNHMGVPIAFTDASGTAVSPPSYTLPGFPGQVKTLSDLYYNRYRDYDSSTGRYIQADPIGLNGGSNPYLYANANPLRWIDPWGLEIGDQNRFFPGSHPNHTPKPAPYPHNPNFGPQFCDSYYAPGTKLNLFCETFGNSPAANCARSCLHDRLPKDQCGRTITVKSGDQPPLSWYYADHPVCWAECGWTPASMIVPSTR
jgi:RHS repeat-associated protein